MADLNESADGSTVHLAVGETRLLVLGERPSTGFRWQIASSNDAVVTVAPAAFRARSERPGDGGQRSFLITALRAGSATVTGTNQRGASADALVDRRCTVTFVVT